MWASQHGALEGMIETQIALIDYKLRLNNVDSGNIIQNLCRRVSAYVIMSL